MRKQKKKAQLRAKFECLEHKKADGFIDEKYQMNGNKYAYQLSLECSKCIQDPDIYLALLQCKLTVYLLQVDNVFRQKPITYFTKIDKILFAVNYFAGIIKNKWKSENEQITADPICSYMYAGYCEFLQEYMKPAHIRQTETIVQIGDMYQ